MVTFVRTAIINGIDNGLLVIIVQDKIMEIGIIYLFRENVYYKCRDIEPYCFRIFYICFMRDIWMIIDAEMHLHIHYLSCRKKSVSIIYFF